ncbi:MAG: response regulator [Rhizobiaceae bacterium]|nr:response regulator [Rhizobiaceae bacterium]
MRILLIEDDALFGDALKEHLGSAGWAITWVSSFKTAVQALQRSTFDLVCLDRRLPDGDGFDILRQRLAKCPIIVLSAFNQPSDHIESKRLGASDYLGKPINLDVVVRRIEALVASARIPSP